MRRKVLRSKARVTRTPRKDHLGKNGNAGVVEKRDTFCLTVERLLRMTVNCRYANSQVQPVAEFIPILEVNFQHLEKGLGSRVLTLPRDSGSFLWYRKVMRYTLS